MTRLQSATSSLFAVLAVVLPMLLAGCGGAEGGATRVTTSNSATLAWDPPGTSNDVSGYRIYYGTTPGDYVQPYGEGISVGNVTSYTLLGLSSATRFYFAVTAVDSSGNESAYSNEAFKDVP